MLWYMASFFSHCLPGLPIDPVLHIWMFIHMKIRVTCDCEVPLFQGLSSGSQPGLIWPPSEALGNICRYCYHGEMLLVPSGQGPGLLLHILQCTAENYPPEMSALSLRVNLFDFVLLLLFLIKKGELKSVSVE